MLRLEAGLPDGFDAFAEVVEDVAALDAAAGREEAADDAGDVASDVEVLLVFDTDALHTQAEAADAGKDDRLALTQFLLHEVLDLGGDTYHSALRETTVATSFFSNLIERHFSLTDCFCKIFSLRAAALDVVLDKFNMYCHNFL